MKQKLAVVSASWAITAIAVLGAAQSSNAQDLRSRYSRQTIQPIAQAAPSGSAPASSTITPTKATALPSQYGIIRSISGNNIEVRGLDGTTRQIAVSGEFQSYASGLQQGSVVGFDTDAATGNLTKLEAAQVDRTVSGTISAINGDQVTVISPSGESITTPVSTATIARMGLTAGKELIVTTYQGTWATKICCPATPAPVSNIVPTPVPQPIGAPFLPPAPKPVPGLW